MDNFTPVSAFIGGSFIGLSALVLMLAMGRVAGCSGIISATMLGAKSERHWRLAFLFGLIAGPVATGFVGINLPGSYPLDWVSVIVGGLLVGFGAALGSGCTSGHGICGMGRLSNRSIAATGVFMATGFVSTYFYHHLL